MEWIEGMENYFEYLNIIEAQKVKVAKSRMRGPTLTQYKFIQGEGVKEGKNPIAIQKGMVANVRETYLPKYFEVQLNNRRQNLMQRDNDVTNYIEEFQKLYLRLKV